MKSFKGILFITLTLILTATLWYYATPREEIHVINKWVHVVGGLALTGFFLVFLLSSRNKTIERWFNGLENVYFYHKCLAVFSLGMVILHGQLQELVPKWGKGMETSLGEFAEELGEIAQNGFIALILIAFFAKFLKYEHWRIIHRLMIIPYAIGLFHAYFTSRYDLFQPTLLGIFTAGTSIVGLASAIYMLVLYQHTQFKHTGTVTNIRKIGTHAVELELTLNEKLTFKNGQYIFLKIFQNGLERAPHPFSISGGDGEKIYVTIKALGDFTKKVNETIQLNTKVAVEGPYGHLNFEDAKQNQVWIAGGVGITPFLSYLKSTPLDRDIELFYTYRGPDDAIFKDFLEDYAQNHDHFKVNFIDTSTMERLTFEDYVFPKDTSIFLCGPQKMVRRFAKQCKHQNPDADIAFEAFKFR